MRKYKYLYLFTAVLLCFSFFKLSNIYAQQKEFIVDSILINNEEIDIKNGCNLELKYNDVLRITGKDIPESEVTLLFADQEYTTVSDENGNWMILISIPYIEGGEYKLSKNTEKICRINLNIEEEVLNQSINRQENNSNNTSFIIYLLLVILVLAFFLYFYLHILKKKKKR